MRFFLVLLLLIGGCKSNDIQIEAGENEALHQPLDFRFKTGFSSISEEIPEVCLGEKYLESTCTDNGKPNWSHPVPGARITSIYYNKNKHFGIDFAYLVGPEDRSEEAVGEKVRYYIPYRKALYREYVKGKVNELHAIKPKGKEGVSTLWSQKGYFYPESNKATMFQATDRSIVYAMQSGYVIYSGWYGSGGNTIMILNRLPDQFPLTKRQKQMFEVPDDQPHMLGNVKTDLQTLGVTHTYMHLFRRFVRAGQFVKRGDQIGIIGGTGGSGSKSRRFTAPHLHLELQLELIKTDPQTGKSISIPTGELIYPFDTRQRFKYNFDRRDAEGKDQQAIVNEYCPSTKEFVEYTYLKEKWERQKKSSGRRRWVRVGEEEKRIPLVSAKKARKLPYKDLGPHKREWNWACRSYPMVVNYSPGEALAHNNVPVESLKEEEVVKQMLSENAKIEGAISYRRTVKLATEPRNPIFRIPKKFEHSRVKPGTKFEVVGVNRFPMWAEHPWYELSTGGWVYGKYVEIQILPGIVPVK